MADIIFLVDSSWSIGKEHFQLVREFLYDVVKALDVGGNDFRFALVQFSGNPHTEFQLNTYPSTRDVLSHIANMPYMGGGTKTGKGLEYLIENHLTKAAGSRASEGIPQVIIVLTDGRSQDDVALPSSVLKSAHVNMFAVGMQDAVEGELKEIASEPFDMHLFNLENFTALHGIVGDLVVSVRSSMTPEKAGAKGLVKDITGNGWLLMAPISMVSAGVALFKAFVGARLRWTFRGLKTKVWSVWPRVCSYWVCRCLQTQLASLPVLPGGSTGALGWAAACCSHAFAPVAWKCKHRKLCRVIKLPQGRELGEEHTSYDGDSLKPWPKTLWRLRRSLMAAGTPWRMSPCS